jgi:wobble nucleotide-excising tRNase
LFVDNLYICFGYGKEEFTDEKITIFTTDSEYYSRDLYDKTDGNKKDITLRWIHLLDKATSKISILDDANDEIDSSYQIRWYKYKYGAPSADEYSGVYWERIYPEATA